MHLGLLQDVIQRMASNSSQCKTWAVTVVSAVLVVVADKDKPEFAWIALVPTILFLFLDAYYLALEKAFRKSYNDFVEKLHSSTATSEDLYALEPHGSTNLLQLDALRSVSIWGFYLGLLVLIGLARFIVLP